ncbi:MAG: penicillin-binding protein 2 [Candidatus Magasanikbacteria bacterium RIFOXYC2_FULL_42_28]|uniref:Penicillin-binding protein 2 n=1 Tax=Candidatus Magasanikbacteria bacterium RIFOXYC2_FULL_42_28 TaxID=1798704 RepID=A0A1F6NW76_9BACT|nr:MAG: penicillin-binding protein 2 [Candidatus Magasanikbacteria bacterium RIFOXYC2_FULL_42_28]
MADLWRNINGTSDANLTGKYRHKWVEENFLPPNKGAETISTGTRNFLGRALPERRLKIFAGIMILGFLIVIAKTSYWQIFNGEKYLALSENNRIRIKPIPAERGVIVDKFGKQLVQNVPNFSLNIVPQDVPREGIKRREVVESVATTTGLSYEEIEALLYKYRFHRLESITVKDNLDYSAALKQYIKNAELPGVNIESGTRRNYEFTNFDNPNKALSLSHILGYLGKINDAELEKLGANGYLISDNIGRTGLEKIYEKELRGIYGKKKIEVDAYGREQNIVAQEAPVPGKNLYLSIDLEAQQQLEKFISAGATKEHPRLAAVALNPQTGAILAMVSWPAYDNNKFAGGISRDDYATLSTDPDQPLFNRVIAGSYPSGSTIKPVMVAAALEEGVITKNTTIMSVGGIYVGDRFFRDWRVGGHGATNAQKAIAQSINSFFYYIGGGYRDFEGLGVERIAKYLKKFGLGAITGIDLTGEAPGLVPDPTWKQANKKEQWYIGDTYNLSIGQGDLLVTPLQVAVWTAAIANGGRVVHPHLGEKLVDPATNTITTLGKEPTDPVISAPSVNLAKQGMGECVKTGSCHLLSYLPFTAGGKTGTAQWSATKNTHAWFTAFAPYENPQVVITVLMEEGGEGGVVSIPIAREFLAWWGKKYLTQ